MGSGAIDRNKRCSIGEAIRTILWRLNMDSGVVAGALGLLCFIAVIAIVVAMLFFMTLIKALNRCAPGNRSMEPEMVWLNLIPIFNLYWNFHTVNNVGDSLKREFADRDLDNGSDYGKSLGTIMLATEIGSWVVSNVGNAADSPPVSLIGSVLSLAGLVLFILYWVRIAGFSGQLKNDENDRDDRDDRDFDDRPRSPRLPGSTDITSKDDRIR